MFNFRKSPPRESPQRLELQRRERALVEKQLALESQLLDTPDARDSNQILREIDALNAQIGVVRAEIGELPN